jgi:hypothetical protein
MLGPTLAREEDLKISSSASILSGAGVLARPTLTFGRVRMFKPKFVLGYFFTMLI